MSSESSAVLDPPGVSPNSLVPPSGPSTEHALQERWDAWRARGARHEHKVRRRMRVAGLLLLVVGAIGVALRVIGAAR